MLKDVIVLACEIAMPFAFQLIVIFQCVGLGCLAMIFLKFLDVFDWSDRSKSLAFFAIGYFCMDIIAWVLFAIVQGTSTLTQQTFVEYQACAVVLVAFLVVILLCAAICFVVAMFKGEIEV